MKKTRYQKFMVSLTKKALAEQTLETFEDHLNYTVLSIQMELLKKGEKKKTTKKRERPQSRVDQISGALGTTKRTAIRIGAGLKKVYGFLTTGNNLAKVIIGAFFTYAAFLIILEMI